MSYEPDIWDGLLSAVLVLTGLFLFEGALSLLGVNKLGVVGLGIVLLGVIIEVLVLIKRLGNTKVLLGISLIINQLISVIKVGTLPLVKS